MNDLAILRAADIIPVDVGGKTEWRRSNEVFFTDHYEPLSSFFTKVNFGPIANSFLSFIGVQERPTPCQLCEILSSDSVRIFNELGPEKYLNILRSIALHHDDIDIQNPHLFLNLKSCQFLLGIQNSSGTVKIPDHKSHITLAYPDEIYLADDTIAAQLFSMLTTPGEPTLEMFYAKMGCKKVSDVVKQSCKYYGVPYQSPESLDLQSLIRHRAPILWDSIRTTNHLNAKSSEELTLLNILQVDAISIEREFGHEKICNPTTACSLRADTILITEKFDHFDVAAFICRIISQDCRLTDSLLISALLSMSMENLQSKGFPVENLLNIPASPLTYSPVKPRIKITQTQPRNSKLSLKDPSKDNSLVQRLKNILSPASSLIKNTYSPTPLGFHDGALCDLLNQSAKGCNSSNSNIVSFTNDKASVFRNDVPSQSFCFKPTDLQLQFHNTTKSKVKIYLNGAWDLSSSNLFVKNRAGLTENFSNLLLKIGTIFGLKASQINIFFTDNTSLIAFNSNSTLYFNGSYYENQILEKLALNKLICSWFITIAHELAHNFSMYILSQIFRHNLTWIIREHDEKHEFFMSAYIEHHIIGLVDNL